MQQAARREAKWEAKYKRGTHRDFFTETMADAVTEWEQSKMARVVKRAKDITPGGIPQRAVATVKALPFHNSMPAENCERVSAARA